MHRNRHVFDIRRLEFDQRQERTLVLTGLVISFLIMLWRQHGFWVAALGCGLGLAFAVLIYITAVYIRGGGFPRGRVWDYQTYQKKMLFAFVNTGRGACAGDEEGEPEGESEGESSDVSSSEEEKEDREEKARFPPPPSPPTAGPPATPPATPLHSSAASTGGGSGGGDGGDSGGDGGAPAAVSTKVVTSAGHAVTTVVSGEGTSFTAAAPTHEEMGGGGEGNRVRETGARGSSSWPGQVWAAVQSRPFLRRAQEWVKGVEEGREMTG